jgi:hypothetical protein
MSDFSGQWKADLAASTLRGDPPTAIFASIAHQSSLLRVEMKIVSGNSAPNVMTFEVRIDGEPTHNSVRGTDWVSRSHWVGRELLIESEVSHAAGRMHFRDYWSLSDDGRRLTMEHRDDDLAGQVTVLDRIDL